MPRYVAIWVRIVENQDAPSKHWEEDRRLVITTNKSYDYFHFLTIWTTSASEPELQGRGNNDVY